MREASNGGASGRVCADAIPKFPANKISAASKQAAFHQDFHTIAILQEVQSCELEFKQGIYLHPRGHVSKPKAGQEMSTGSVLLAHTLLEASSL
jgi:hypothetical protein